MHSAPRIRLPTPATHSYSRHHPPWRTRKLRLRRFLTFLSILVFLFFIWRIAYSYDKSRTRPSGINVESLERYTGSQSQAPAFRELRNLVVVAGHAIWLGGKSLGMNDTEWNLKMGREGEGKTYVRHIEAGVKAALEDPQSLLVFSGGETDINVGPRSESQSYFDLAYARGLITPSLLPRVTTEFTALDSYQNLLFSIARFHEYTANYPRKITVISHGFKEDRFRTLHRKAINYPESKFFYIGIDPEDVDIEKIRESELASGIQAWTADPYACDPYGVLNEKRRERGWSRRGNGYWETCPELRNLLEWCEFGGGSHLYYDQKLPWS